MAMTSKDEPIPDDVQKAFDLAAKALFAWSAKTYNDMMPADKYWRMVHHANCSPRRRLQASKLSHDSSYPTGAKCLVEWVHDKHIESKVYTPQHDYLAPVIADYARRVPLGGRPRASAPTEARA
jgi:hypothetical protein